MKKGQLTLAQRLNNNIHILAELGRLLHDNRLDAPSVAPVVRRLDIRRRAGLDLGGRLGEQLGAGVEISLELGGDLGADVDVGVDVDVCAGADVDFSLVSFGLGLGNGEGGGMRGATHGRPGHGRPPRQRCR